MHNMDRKAKLEKMVSNLADIVAFADQQEDYVLAAKGEDVRLLLESLSAKHAD